MPPPTPNSGKKFLQQLCQQMKRVLQTPYMNGNEIIDRLDEHYEIKCVPPNVENDEEATKIESKIFFLPNVGTV